MLAGKSTNEKRVQISRERDEHIHDKEHSACDHHGLREQLERKQVALPHITSFGLTEQEGGVDDNAQRKRERRSTRRMGRIAAQ